MSEGRLGREGDFAEITDSDMGFCDQELDHREAECLHPFRDPLLARGRFFFSGFLDKLSRARSEQDWIHPRGYHRDERDPGLPD